VNGLFVVGVLLVATGLAMLVYAARRHRH